MRAYSRAPNHVGCVYTFSSQLEVAEGSSSAGCRNCAEQQKKGVLSTAQVPITSALLSTAKNPDIPQLQSLEPQGVENYLTANLQWIAVEVSFYSISFLRACTLSLTTSPYPKFLYWTCANSPNQVGGNLVNMTQLPATKIFVMKGIGDHPADPTQLSHYHSYTPMWDITRNKAGGAGPNDGLVPASGA